MNKADVIELARASDRLAMGFDIEGVNAIGDQLSQLHRYHDLGVRWMQLACNNNRGGGACQDADTGLTPFGRDVIREMKRIDLRVCCNHTRYCTVRDVCEMATRPVFFSHSNSKAVYTHPRNIPDDLIRACAASGGVVGVNGIGRFLGKNDSTSATYARHQTREARRTCFSFSRRPSARLALVASSR